MVQDGVHLLSDHTGRASGEAFVYFVDKQSARDALDRDMEKIGHRWGDIVYMWWEENDRQCCFIYNTNL